MAIDLNDLTFGIEIECCIRTSALMDNGWSIGAYHQGAEIPGFPGWKAMHDGSIQTRYPRVGCEVVSPILRGAEGFAQIAAMVNQLNAMDASVNQSTGFHVHVGFANGTPAQLRRLVHFVAHHEPALFAATGTHSRECNHFCSSIKLTHRAAVEATQAEPDAIARRIGRYHVLNLTNLRAGGKRTVEFRVFAGTLNLLKIQTYVQLCLGMVQKAMEASATLAWDAPISAKQTREQAKPGQWAVRQLIAQLGWYAKGERKAYGVFDRTTVPAMHAKLRELAAKYDGPDTATEPQQAGL